MPISRSWVTRSGLSVSSMRARMRETSDASEDVIAVTTWSSFSQPVSISAQGALPPLPVTHH